MRFQSIWCTLLFFQFFSFKDASQNSFVQFSTVQIKQYLRELFYSRIKIGRLIYKRPTLSHTMTRFHSISTKGIPIHTFVDEFANFNPRIHILSFLDCAQAGVLITVQSPFLRCLGSHENVNNKSVHQIIWNLKTHHFKYGVLTTFWSLIFLILILE